MRSVCPGASGRGPGSGAAGPRSHTPDTSWGAGPRARPDGASTSDSPRRSSSPRRPALPDRRGGPARSASCERLRDFGHSPEPACRCQRWWARRRRSLAAVFRSQMLPSPFARLRLPRPGSLVITPRPLQQVDALGQCRGRDQAAATDLDRAELLGPDEVVDRPAAHTQPVGCLLDREQMPMGLVRLPLSSRRPPGCRNLRRVCRGSSPGLSESVLPGSRSATECRSRLPGGM